jgi:plastocyanin
LLTRRRRRAVLSAALLASVVVAGMSRDVPAAAHEATAVDIHSYRFDPADVTVDAGTTVTWTNHDRAAHDVTFTSGAITSGSLPTGQSWSFTFEDPGTVTYLCQVHPDMTGTITVRAVDEPTTVAAAANAGGPTSSLPPAPPTSAPVPTTAPPRVVTEPVRNRLSIDPRLLIAAGLAGVIVGCTLLLGRTAAHA